MAPPSPRRSSRARGNTVTQSNQSSSASSLSSRAERNTRSLNKTTSTKSTPTSASLSSEPLDEPEDSLLPRRRTRAQEEIRDKIQVDPYDMGNDADDIQEDDESVRCICGFDEYPGPPPFDEEIKHGKNNPEADFFASIELSEEVSGLFVQCDVCKVWQHGACVGIFTEESSPDEYFCEKCRKDLHKIHVASNSQRYSNYLPLGRQSRSSSRATSVAKDGTRSPKESSGRSARASSAAQAAKRRSTMNSRDAAYDEDEQLRRAIEASKEEAPEGESDLIPRRLKRGRSNSQENQLSLKRQRTSSPSMSPPPESNFAIEDNSEDDSAGRNGISKKLRIVGNPKERTEREERDRQRMESANKRKGRADRRRADGTAAPAVPSEREGHSTAESETAEEVGVAAARPAVKQNVEQQPPPPPPPPVVEPTPSGAPTPDPTPAPQAPTGSTHKKSSRSHQKRAKGRNQYTKDRDDHEASPARSMSRDTIRLTEDSNGGSGTAKNSGADHGRHAARSKAHLHSKTTLPDMKRRVAAFLDFISKTQIEMAGESSSGSGSSQNNSGQHSPREIATSTTDTHGNGTTDTEPKDAATTNGEATARPRGQDFKELNCVEMMDVLTRDLVKWQNQYAS